MKAMTCVAHSLKPPLRSRPNLASRQIHGRIFRSTSVSNKKPSRVMAGNPAAKAKCGFPSTVRWSWSSKGRNNEDYAHNILPFVLFVSRLRLLCCAPRITELRLDPHPDRHRSETRHANRSHY